MNKRFIYIFLGIFLISFSMASTEIYRVLEPSNLQFSCTINNALVSSNAILNLSIYYPNGTSIINNKQTTSQGQGSFNYTITFPETGKYKVKIFCYDSPYNYSSSGNYDVTPIGKELTLQKTITYILIFFFSILFLIGFLYAGMKLEGENSKDMAGYILQVSNIKYLKLVLLGFAYLTLLFINYLIWMITYAYLDFNFVTNIFRFIFTFQAILTLPLFILFCYILITNLIRDSKLNEMLSRGLNIK